ncbi:MAG: two-component regulator propeller domain-containing protein [Saprospiraceae bacterium]
MMRVPLIILFLVGWLVAHAQQPLRHFSHWTTRDGLSSNDVTCLLRDKEGYLWVGTSQGLNRFDGVHFKTFLPDARRPTQTVSSEVIHALAQDSDGYIWMATANGLNRYDPATATFKVWKSNGESNSNTLPNSLVNNLLIDQDGLIWLACDNRDLCVFDPKSKPSPPTRGSVLWQIRSPRIAKFTKPFITLNLVANTNSG